MSKHVGEMIKKYRLKRGFTQKQLGELCNIADSNIRKYESGRQNPKLETIEKIANVLDVHPLVLLGQISEKLDSDLKTSIDPSESFISLFKYIYDDIDIVQNISADGSKSYSYVLDNDSTISELTFDNTFESIENVIKMSVDNAIKHDSQIIFRIIYSLKNLSFSDLKMIENYAYFLMCMRKKLPPFDQNNGA